jgi:hypothetical protein
MKKNMVMNFLILISFLISFSVSADVIDPVGEENLGYLRLHAPISLLGKNLFTAYLNDNNNYIQIDNQKNYRLLKGDYCFANMSLIPFEKLPCFSILPKQTTVFDNYASFTLFPTLEIGQWDNKSPTARIVNDKGAEHYLGVLDQSPSEYWIAPGNYKIVWSDWLVGYPQLGSTSFSVSKGQSLPVQLDRFPKSYLTELTFNKTGKALFPDAVEHSMDCKKIGEMQVSKYFIFRDLKLDSLSSVLNSFYNKSYATQATLFFDSVGQSTLRFYPYLNVNYSLLVNGVPYVFQFSKPATRLEIPIKHIDVKKVTVTREDGTTYITSGTYSIEVKINGKYQLVNVPEAQYSYNDNQCSFRSVTKFKTETGLDLPPNEYKFTVYYDTIEGKAQSKEYFLDLR